MSENAGAWEEFFADLKARGLRAPHLIVGDGADGVWSAVTKAWPGAAQQRCWIHKIRNVEEKVPKDHRSAVRAALSEAMHAETAPLARAKIEKLAKSYERRYPKAAACIRADSERLLAYYRFPSATWIHLRTTNAILKRKTKQSFILYSLETVLGSRKIDAEGVRGVASKLHSHIYRWPDHAFTRRLC